LIWPAGKRLIYRHTSHSKTDNGDLEEGKCYEAEECTGCSLREKTTKAKGNRQVRMAFQLNIWRQQARQNLTSENGKKLCFLRGMEVESVFGRLKQDWSFRRFPLRDLQKVKTEVGLLCITQNIAKLAVCCPPVLLFRFFFLNPWFNKGAVSLYF